MADFYQHARVPTLHHLAHADSSARESEMLDWAKDKPVALLLPALYAECERPALPRILEEVSQAGHISEVILSMNGMDAAELERARAFPFGATDMNTLSLVRNDWYMTRQIQETVKCYRLGGPFSEVSRR